MDLGRGLEKDLRGFEGFGEGFQGFCGDLGTWGQPLLPFMEVLGIPNFGEGVLGFGGGSLGLGRGSLNLGRGLEGVLGAY